MNHEWEAMKCKPGSLIWNFESHEWSLWVLPAYDEIRISFNFACDIDHHICKNVSWEVEIFINNVLHVRV